MTERTEAEEFASNDAELLEPPADGAYATIQLQSFFSRVLRPEAMGAGYKGLAASELRILLHLISRMEFRNKVKHSQVWLANDLGITPQAYCRGIATLERCDFVRKKLVSEESPRLIEYMVLNPLLVRRLSAKSLPDVLKMYQSLPNDKVTFKIRPNPAQKAQEHVALTKIGTKIPKESPLIPFSSTASDKAIPIRVEETYSDLDVDLESQLVRAAQSEIDSDILPEKPRVNSHGKSNKRKTYIPEGLKNVYNPDPQTTATTELPELESDNMDMLEA
jgi:hypothetical protein